MDCNEYIQVFISWEYDYDIIIFNNITVIYEKKFQYFDYYIYIIFNKVFIYNILVNNIYY